PRRTRGIGDNVLNSVSGSASTDVWGVGYYTFEIEKRTLVEHWNGSEWSIVPSPNTDKRINVLNGMVAISPSNVWAVGSATSDGLEQTTLILQCPGTAGLNTLYAV